MAPAATGSATDRGTERRAAIGPLPHSLEQRAVERERVDHRLGGARRAQAAIEVIGQIVVFHWGRSFVVISVCAARRRRRARAARIRNAAGVIPSA